MTRQELHALLGTRWAIPVLMVLSDGPSLRFNAAKLALPGVSQRMLSLSLRSLLAAGLVCHVGDLYGITDRGSAVLWWSRFPAFDWLVAS